MFIRTAMIAVDFKRMCDKTGVLKEQVNISEGFSLFDASYSAFDGGSVGHTKVI
jgi:hypothetical protein